MTPTPPRSAGVTDREKIEALLAVAKAGLERIDADADPYGPGIQELRVLLVDVRNDAQSKLDRPVT